MNENNHTAGSDILETYYKEQFPKLMNGAVRRGMEKNFQEFRGERKTFRIWISMPAKKNYRALSLLFEPDYLDLKKYRLYAEAPLRWNPDYSIRNELIKGTPEELCAWIVSPECEKMIKEVSVHLDESKRHDGP